MKILHIGNVASVGYNLCKELRKRNIKADLVYRPVSNIISGTDEEWIYLAKNRFQSLRLCDINLKDYDLIHCHCLVSLLSLGSRIRNHKIPVILHCHGSDARPDKLLYKIIQKLVLTQSNILLYSTPDLLSSINKLKKEKIYFPNPVNLTKKIPKNKKYNNRILIFSRLEKIKKIEKLFPIIKNLNYSFDIPYLSKDKEYYKKIIPRNVHFIKQVPHDNISDLLTKYRLVIGQQTGTIGVSSLESMSCRIPTLLPFKYNHFYKRPLPMKEINERNIKELFTNHHLGELQYEWVKEFHNPFKLCEKLVRIYHNILEK